MSNPQSRDTTPQMEQRQIEAWREMSLSRKFALAVDLSRTADEMSRAGIRLQYPEASEREIRLRLAARRLGRATIIKVFGWDPEADSLVED